jgi:hypothetical protein
MSATALSCIRAVRDCVKGYVFGRGFQLGFTTTWLDKPQG